jgi:predicted XRE-type DNA-binding protein
MRSVLSRFRVIKRCLKCAIEVHQDRGTKRPDRSHIESSGNVFADTKVPHSEEALAKAQLVQKIIDSFEARCLTQTQAAGFLQIDQTTISALLRGQLSGLSVGRLLRFLMLLGHDVEITIKSRPQSRSRGRLLVR